ncbi:MAG TPA: hypothetical protein PLF81_05645 [Candidatus Anammoximicrobium sp.]|nr:hypothetical protein [Candidatus Anammoximicrobium sp.]
MSTDPNPSSTATPVDGSASADGDSDRSGSRGGCRRHLFLTAIVVLAGVAALVWRATRPVDTTPPEAVLVKVEPNKPLFSEHEQRVTFVLRDDQGGIPTFFVFEGEDRKATALGINTLRGTPNERGVEIRFEAIRFRRDEAEPDQLWVRAVGIANETEGKTPISRSQLERGESLDLHFHDEIQVPYVAHVIYDIYMTIQYDPRTQQLTLTNASGSIRWKMLGSDAFDEGKLETVIRGQKGEYAEKPLLKF